MCTEIKHTMLYFFYDMLYYNWFYWVGEQRFKYKFYHETNPFPGLRLKFSEGGQYIQIK